jgi:MFS family permease
MSPKKILEAHIPLKQLAPAVILVVNTMIWFAITSTVLTTLTTPVDNPSAGASFETLALNGLYYAGIALSAFIGAIVIPCQKEKRLLLWMMFGVLTTISVMTFQSNQIGMNAFLSLLLGMSIGMGLPSSLAYFANTTAVENRGTYGGLIWLPVGFGVLTLAFAWYSLGVFWALFILAIWRASGGALFFVLSRLRGKQNLEAKKSSYGTILRRRDLMLYLIPWIMFSLVNFSEYPIVSNVSKTVLGNFQLMAGSIEFAISGVSAVIGGVLSDLVGRKRIVITGFIILGIEYAILSLFSGAPPSWYVYMLCDGIAWGLFASVFFMTIWGDLAETAQKEKYYVIGGLPYLLAGFMAIVVQPFAANIRTVTAFSLASFFLFVAVLPLMYAPETLPEKKIKGRELRDYLEKAKRTKDKYA